MGIKSLLSSHKPAEAMLRDVASCHIKRGVEEGEPPLCYLPADILFFFH